MLCLRGLSLLGRLPIVVLSFFSLIFLPACTPTTMLAVDAWAAGTLTGATPWAIDRVLIVSTTDWDVWTSQTWARQCLIKNEHADEPMYFGNYDETSTFVAATDNYITIAAGSAVTYQLVPDVTYPITTHRAIPLASATASHPVSILCVAAVP